MNGNYFVLVDTEGRMIANFNTCKRAWIHFKSLITSGIECELRILNAEQLDELIIEDLKRKAKNYDR